MDTYAVSRLHIEKWWPWRLHLHIFLLCVYVKYFYRKFMDLEFFLYESLIIIYIYLKKDSERVKTLLIKNINNFCNIAHHFLLSNIFFNIIIFRFVFSNILNLSAKSFFSCTKKKFIRTWYRPVRPEICTEKDIWYEQLQLQLCVPYKLPKFCDVLIKKLHCSNKNLIWITKF